MAVFVGGGAGSLVRFFLQKGLAPYSGLLPAGTLAANVLSCLIVGWMVAKSEHLILGQTVYKNLLITGFCGGFSTFSTLIRENWQMGSSGFTGLALAYDAISFALGLGSLVAGLWLGKLF